jgi:hypothetical protein
MVLRIAVGCFMIAKKVSDDLEYVVSVVSTSSVGINILS